MPNYDRELATRVTAAIAAVHRRPVSLRKWQVTSSEGILRGARLSALIDAQPEESAVSVYSLLAPDSVDTTVRTFVRAPLQILAKMDVLAGGDGKPTGSVSALQHLASVLVQSPPESPGIVHAVIAVNNCFGPRSGVIARASARVAAIATGMDPRGLSVPESYLNRHQREYREALARFAAHPNEFLDFQLKAFLAGAEEADSIAVAAATASG